MSDCFDEPFLVFDFCDRDGRPKRTCFNRPERIVEARLTNEVRPALRLIEQAVADGFYAAGYIAYEAAPAFDSAMTVKTAAPAPLLWFGLFRAPAETFISDKTLSLKERQFELTEWRPSIDKLDYAQNIGILRETIANGDSYQVNYTLRLRAEFSGDDFALYRHLSNVQRGKYGAYLNTGKLSILSASPELFFRLRDRRIIVRPMKGTVRRGRWNEDDDVLSAWLADSAKNRAENVMIVDLLRNDLGRISETGSIEVTNLYDVERYPTLFQMTSQIEATLRDDASLESVFAALFPCGSITGAPKISTMKIIAALEDSPRGVYCGSIGMIAPDGEAIFNVAIRTVVIDGQTGQAEYGVGGGVTWESTADDEYEESRIKAGLLLTDQPEFELIETLRLENGKYFLYEEHLERINASALYFDFENPAETARRALREHARRFPNETRRVRLLVSRRAEARIESESLTPHSTEISLPVALASAPVSRNDRFLYHKTTSRKVYEAHKNSRPDVYDVLLWNEEGELTEFTTGNLVVEIDGACWTPERDCGLLCGTLRAHLFKRGEIRERKMTRGALSEDCRLWLINSVHGWVPVTLVK